jgi:hypothetical protein
MTENAAVGSFEPDDHSQGGFFDDVDCVIVSAEVVEFDYKGQADPVCAIAVTYKRDEADADEEDRTEYYRIGNLTDFTPSADRKHYAPVGTKTAMNKSGKASLFLQALKKAGFPMGNLAAGIDAINGLHVHVNQVPMPEMKDAKKKDNTVLIVTKILDTAAPAAAAAPAKGAAKPAAAKAKPAAAAKAAPATTAVAAGTVDSAAEDKATEIIVGLIAAGNGKVNKAAIPPAMFSGITGDANLRNACIKLSSNVAWMQDANRPWKFEGGELSFPE